MTSLFSLVAILCALAVSVRAICVLDALNWRTRCRPYWQFLLFGTSAAGVACCACFMALEILQGRAQWYVYGIVYSLGALTFLDRRSAPGVPTCSPTPHG